MAKHMLFPDVGEGITEGTLIKWLVKEGDAVKEDQPLAEIETDKAVVEIPSRMHGTILKLFGRPGEMLKVHTPLVTIGNPGEPIPPVESGGQPDSKPTAAQSTSSTPVQNIKAIPPVASISAPHTPSFIAAPAVPQAISAPSMQPQAAPSPAPTAGGAILAPPSVRALARQLGVDLSTVSGSGPGGRITTQDVENAKSGTGKQAVAMQTGQPASPVAPEKKIALDLGTGTRKPLSHLRKTIADRMSYSWRHNAHVFYFEEVDFGALNALREKMKPAAEAAGIKLTPLSFVFKALAAALKNHPHLNASLDEEKQELVLHDYYNFAFGVDTEEGLVAPVLKSVDSKNILAVAKEVREIAERARSRKAGVEDFKGSTFTITNLGSIGGAFVSAVINPPEVAILGIYRTKDKPVVRDGQVVIRPMTMIGLTFDHRVCDGASAGRFVNELVEKLENPGWMESA